jgi:hypothetical protein
MAKAEANPKTRALGDHHTRFEWSLGYSFVDEIMEFESSKFRSHVHSLAAEESSLS